MTTLYILSEDFLRELFGKWLKTQDFVKFDTSLCNRKLRKYHETMINATIKIQSFVRFKYSNLVEELYDSPATQWFSAKGLVKYTFPLIQMCNPEDALGVDIHPFCLNQLTALSLVCYSIRCNPDVFVSLAKHCNNLKEFCVSNSFNQSLEYSSTLGHEISQFIKANPNLRRLGFSLNGGHTSLIEIVSSAHNNPKLTDFTLLCEEFDSHITLSNEDSLNIINAFPTYTTCQVDHDGIYLRYDRRIKKSQYQGVFYQLNWANGSESIEHKLVTICSDIDSLFTRRTWLGITRIRVIIPACADDSVLLVAKVWTIERVSQILQANPQFEYFAFDADLSEEMLDELRIAVKQVSNDRLMTERNLKFVHPRRIEIFSVYKELW